MKTTTTMAFRGRCRWTSSKTSNTCQLHCRLPSQASVDILFRCFCVGVSTSFGIVTRFDRLMHATKELVGEQYHIHGVGHVSKVGGVEMVSGTDLVRPIHDA